MRSPLGLLSSRPNRPSSLSLSSPEMLQSPDHLCSPQLGLSQELQVSLKLRNPALNTELQMCLARAAPPLEVGKALPKAAWAATGLLGHKDTLLTLGQLFGHQHPQVFLCRATSQQVSPEPGLVLGLFLPRFFQLVWMD